MSDPHNGRDENTEWESRPPREYVMGETTPNDPSKDDTERQLGDDFFREIGGRSSEPVSQDDLETEVLDFLPATPEEFWSDSPEGRNDTRPIPASSFQPPPPYIPPPLPPGVPTGAPVDPKARQIADGIKLAFTEMRGQFKQLITEAITDHFALSEAAEKRNDPEIEYEHRRHAFEGIVNVSGPVLVFLVLTSVYVLFAGNPWITLPVVGVVTITSVMAAILIKRKANRIEDEAIQKQFKNRWFTLFWLVSISIWVLLAFVLSLLGVSIIWSGVYLLTVLITCYVYSWLYYKWSGLIIKREGELLRAYRPKRDRFFMPTFSRELYLRNVNDVEFAQSWLSQKIGMYRFFLTLDAEVPELRPRASYSSRQDYEDARRKYANAMFWRDIKYIVDGPRLKAAIKQGIEQTRG